MTTFLHHRRGWIKIGQLGVRYRNISYAAPNLTSEHYWYKILWIFWWGYRVDPMRNTDRLRDGG